MMSHQTAAVALMLSLLLLLALVSPVRSVRMLTRAQSYEVQTGDTVHLQCQFYADSFNLFDYPVVWHKLQHHWAHHQYVTEQHRHSWMPGDEDPVERCQVNMMGNLLEPFASVYRYRPTFVAHSPKYLFGLSLTDVMAEDSANYTCQIDGPLNTVIGQVTHSVHVIGQVEDISIHSDNVSAAVDSSPTITFTENQPSLLRCEVVGSGSMVDPRLYLLDDDVTSGFSVSRSRSTVGGRCMRRERYVTVRWNEQFTVSAEHDGTYVNCSAVIPRFPVPVASHAAMLTVRYSPVIQCDSPTALLGQMNVVLTCEINARPEVTALYWITDAELGITIVAGDSASDFWTSNMVGGDARLVSKLYLRITKPDSFRTYTIIAENLLGTSSHDVTLVQRYVKTNRVAVDHPESSYHVRDGDAVQRISDELGHELAFNDAVVLSAPCLCALLINLLLLMLYSLVGC